MKKQFVIILIFLEIIGILAVGFLYTRWRSSFCVYAIEIPEGMQLTTNKPLELNTTEGAVSIKEGETVIPIGAVKPYVYFLLEQGNSVFSSSWDNFVEEVNLDELQKDADIKSEAARKTLLTKGLISIIVVVLCWLVLVSTASFVLLKKKHTKALLIGHVIAISIISVLVVLASLIN